MRDDEAEVGSWGEWLEVRDSWIRSGSIHVRLVGIRDFEAKQLNIEETKMRYLGRG